MLKVVELADVVVEVLDARDPMGCRDAAVEQLVVSRGKKLVLLLNKIDLVPRENALAWVAYLKNEFPTVPFKASTQLQRSNLGNASYSTGKQGKDGKDANAPPSSDCCFGSEDVLGLLKNYSRTLNTKTCIAVGVVGMPNVGKSSFINSLKRSKVCQVGSAPGITRVVQEIVLDRNIRLLDSPGIVFASGSNSLLRGCSRVEQIEDIGEVVGCILEKQTYTSFYIPMVFSKSGANMEMWMRFLLRWLRLVAR